MKASMSRFTTVSLLIVACLVGYAPQTNVARAAGNDDEKENSANCSTPGKIQIYCTVGTIDCRPKDCP